MSHPTDGEILEGWRCEPAPLLPILHAFHERDGFLSESALRGVSHALKIPIAELYGTVTFYHHFSLEEGGQQAPRVCTGPVCAMRGAAELLESLEGATAMACSGRCDEPIPVLRGNQTLVGTSADSLVERGSPLPPLLPDGIEECVFSQIREPGRATLAGYEATGG